MRTKLNEIIKNGHLGMIAVFFIVYMITFSYIEDRDVHHYIIHTTIDDQIPFCEYFIVPYLLWFLFVAVTVFYFMFFKAVQRPKLLLKYLFRIFFYIEIIHPFLQGLRKWQSASPSREHCPRKTMNDFYVKGNYFFPSFYLF